MSGQTRSRGPKAKSGEIVKVMGRSSNGEIEGNMSSFSLHQVACSSRCREEIAAPQPSAAGHSHLCKKRLHHRTLVENSVQNYIVLLCIQIIVL